MNEEEYITDYITTLATADIELSGNTPAELRFNGTTSPGELYKLLLKKEAIVTRAICQTVLAAANNKMILSMVQQHLLDMKGTITFRDGHIARWRQCARFAAWNVVSLALSEVMIGLLTHFGINPYLAKVGVTLEVALLNYFGYKYIVFAVPKETEGEQDHDRSSVD